MLAFLWQTIEVVSSLECHLRFFHEIREVCDMNTASGKLRDCLHAKIT